MSKFNWDLIMQDNTCVKIKNYEQFRKIQEEYKRIFKGYSLYENQGYNNLYCEFGNPNKGHYNYRDTKEYFKENGYIILKYKDIKIKKKSIV